MPKQILRPLVLCRFSNAYDDDSNLFYKLMNDGRLSDEYESNPSYYDDNKETAPVGGNAADLCEAFGSNPHKIKVIEETLRYDRSDAYDLLDLDELDEPEMNIEEVKYAFESERHAELTRQLGLPDFCAGYSFMGLWHGGPPKGYSREDFVRTG